MKKIISIVLAVIMLVCTVGMITANAVEKHEYDYDNYAYSTVTFRQPSTYCIYVPDVISLDYDYCMYCADLNLADDECLCITLSNMDGNNQLTFANEDESVTMKKTVHTSANQLDTYNPPYGCVGYFTNSSTGSMITFGLDPGYSDLTTPNGSNVIPAGVYSSQAEFNITINPIT